LKFVEEVFGLKFEVKDRVSSNFLERVDVIDRRNNSDISKMCPRKGHLYVDIGVLLFNILAVVVKRLHNSLININKLTKAVNKGMKRMTRFQ